MSEQPDYTDPNLNGPGEDYPHAVTFNDDAADVLPPLDLGALNFADVPDDASEFATPDAAASREPRRSPFRRQREQSDTTERRPRSRTTTTRAKAVPKARPGHFVEPLENVYTMIGALLSPMDNVCGASIIASAPECAKSLDRLAQENDAVRRVLYMLTQTSAWGAVAMAHAPIAMAVAMHHVPAVVEMQANIGARFAEQFANAGNDDEQQNGQQSA